MKPIKSVTISAILICLIWATSAHPYADDNVNPFGNEPSTGGSAETYMTDFEKHITNLWEDENPTYYPGEINHIVDQKHEVVDDEEPDMEVVEQLDDILTMIFDQDQHEGPDFEMLSVEEVEKVIKKANDLLSRLPGSFEVDDRYNHQNRIIADLNELSKDLGCKPSDLHYRVVLAQLVWDNKLVSPYIKSSNERQFDQCRKELEDKILDLASREHLSVYQDNLSKLKNNIEAELSDKKHWIEEPISKLDDVAAKSIEKLLRSSSGLTEEEIIHQTPEQISIQVDKLLKKECFLVRVKLYEYFDDAEVLNEISETATNINQWDLLKPEVRELLENTRACSAIHNLDYKKILAIDQ